MRRWLNDSVFGDGLRVPLPREDRYRLMARLALLRAGRHITATAKDVGEVLVHMLGADGRLDPSQATIATWAHCSLATAKRALHQLRALGFLRWQRRLRRDAGTGWRCEQTSNAYVLCPPCEAQTALPIRRIKIQSLNKPANGQERRVQPVPLQPEDAASAIEALRAIRERRESQRWADSTGKGGVKWGKGRGVFSVKCTDADWTLPVRTAVAGGATVV